MRTSLLNSTAYARINLAPPDMGGGAAGDDDVSGDDELFGADGTDGDSIGNDTLDLGDGDEINLASDPDLKDFWKEGDEGDSTAETAEQRTTRLREEERAMATELQNGLDSFALGEDLIPENFDPTDSQQMREVLAKAVREGAAMTMQLMFKPVNKALKTHNENLRNYVESHVTNSNSANKFESMLARNIPAVTDPMLGPVIKQMASVQQKRYPNDPAAAIRAVQKGLRAMKIPTQTKSSGGGGGRGDESPLDSFFTGLRKSPSNQTRDRLKK